MSEQTDLFRQLAVGLAENWDIPMTDARRQKLVSYTTDLADLLIDYAGDEEKLSDWDSRTGGSYVCDIVDEYLWDRRLILERRGETVGRLGNHISCCIRASLDIAVSASAGVIGFTVGDLRRAFGGDLPEWVSRWFEPGLTSDTPDTDGVWA